MVLFSFTSSKLRPQSPVTITGTIQDAGGNPATNGTVVFDVQPQSSGIHYYVPGVAAVAPQKVTCGIRIDGTLANQVNPLLPCTVWGNDVLSPSNSTYTVTFKPKGQTTNSVPQELITGAGPYNINSPKFGPQASVIPQYNTITTPQISSNLIPIAPNQFTLGNAQAPYAAIYASQIWFAGPDGCLQRQGGMITGTGQACSNSVFHTSTFASSCNVNGTNYTTSGDCAFYTALNTARVSGQNQVVMVDPGVTNTCAGWQHPVLPNNASVSIIGATPYGGAWDIYANAGTPVNSLKQTCNIGTTAVITYQSGGSTANSGPSATVNGVYIDANNNAGACGDFFRLSRSSIANLSCTGVTGTTRHGFQFGDSAHAFSTGWVFETDLENLRVYTQTQVPYTLGGGTVTIVGGAATGAVVTAAGNVGSFSAPTTSYKVIFTGWGVGVTQNSGPAPCTTVPTAHVSSIVNGQLAAIAFDTAGSGCDSAHTYFAVTPKPIMDEAYLFDNYTDGKATNLISVGPVNIASAQVAANSGGFTLKNFHGYAGAPVIVNLIGGSVDIDSLNCDTPLKACVANAGGGTWVHGGVRSHASYILGTGDFWDAQNAKNKYGPIGGCSDPGAGYNLFGSKTGPFDPRKGFSAPNLDIVNVDYCLAGAGYYPVTYLPGQQNNTISIGSTVTFGVNATGVGQATCMATGGAGDVGATPGYDQATNLVTFQPNANNNAGTITCVNVDGRVMTRLIPSTGNSTQTFDIRNLYTAATPSAIAIEQRSQLDDYATAVNYKSSAPVLTSVGPNNATAGNMRLHTASANNSVNNYGINLDPTGWIRLGAATTFFDTGGAYNDRGSNDTAGLVSGGFFLDTQGGTQMRWQGMGLNNTSTMPIEIDSYSANFSVYNRLATMSSSGTILIGGATIDQAGNLKLPALKSTSGLNDLCIDSAGQLSSQATSCTGTGGGGSVTDGSGITTPNRIAVSTAVAHAQAYSTATADGSGNVNIPGTATIGSASVPSQIFTTYAKISAGASCGPATLGSLTAVDGMYVPVCDATSQSDCSTGGGTIKHYCYYVTGTGWVTATPSNLGDPGSNGIVKRTAPNTTAIATASTDYVAEIATGTASLGTSAIGTGACATIVTVSATGTLTTDTILADFNSRPSVITGYGATGGGLTVYKYPTANNVNFEVCNPTAGSITPGAATLNWRVVR